MPRDTLAQGYSRRHRFSQRGSFGPVLRGSHKVRGRFVVVHSLPAPRAARFGLAFTRRVVPRAVDRNRLKRLAREVFRQHPLKRSVLDCVVSLRGRIDDEAAFVAELHTLFDRLAAGSAP